MKSIDIKNLCKDYENTSIKFEDLLIHKRITILKGKNGSGKSTLMKSVLGLIHYKGEITNTITCSYFPEKIPLPSHLKVKTFLDLMLPKSRNQVMNELIQLFHMEDKLDKEIHSLSKGMTMKCRLIYSLSLEKDIYFLDEPFNGLDKESLKRFIDYIKKHQKMFVISTHLDIFERNYETDVIVL